MENSSSSAGFSGVCNAKSLACCAICFGQICLFVFYCLVKLSVILRFTVADYLFGISSFSYDYAQLYAVK
jgi:hypothetical protein